jgi:hypothetical protein
MLRISRKAVVEAVKTFAEKHDWDDVHFLNYALSAMTPIGLWLRDDEWFVDVVGADRTIGAMLLGYSSVVCMDTDEDHVETAEGLLYGLEFYRSEANSFDMIEEVE